jgi:sulfate permease, SulP family
MIALVEAHRAGLLRRAQWLPNVLAGVIVGVVALPLAMAFAIASGAKPEQGIYTAIVAGFLVSALGGSRLQVAGPTGAFIVILSAVTAEHGIEGLQLATLMAGVILVALGAARLGRIIQFIPDPVIAGFTAGIAVIIWVGQWSDFFGLPPVAGRHFHEKLCALVPALAHPHPATTALAGASLALMIAVPRIRGLGRVPAPLVALVAAAAAQAVFHFDGVRTIGSAFGGIPQGLPPLHVPEWSAERAIALIGPAFTIAMLGAIESLLSAVVADGMAGTHHDPNQELIAQGIANVAAPLFGGFAATGALARTATNVRSGATSPLAGMTHAAVLALTVLCLAPLAVHVPLPALAAILFVVAWNMSDARHVARMVRRAPPADVAILAVTFALTVFADLVVAVNIGVILAMLQFLRRMAASVEVRRETDQDLAHELAALGFAHLPPGVAVYAIEGPFFFGAAHNFERTLAATHSEPRALIVRLRWVPFMDITGLHTLQHVIEDLRERGVRVMLAGANARVRGKLERAGVLELLGRENSFASFAEALAASAAADAAKRGDSPAD